jgi:TatD DNase family protein
MTWLTDAHIHLSDNAYSPDLEYILTTMNKLKIKACCVSMDNLTSKSTLELSNRSSLVLPFIGIHPEKADDDLDMMTNLIEQNANKISGIGEIGLDKTYVLDEAGLSRQVLVFQNMLCLAEKLRKPVSIHSRKTLDEIFSLLSSYSIKSVLFHWFSGSKKQLQKAMDLSYFVSYGPATVYSQDKQVLLSLTDLDKILIETDGPVRFSRCFGLKTAQITFLPSVLFSVACVLNKSFDEMQEIIEKNTDTYISV